MLYSRFHRPPIVNKFICYRHIYLLTHTEFHFRHTRYCSKTHADLPITHQSKAHSTLPIARMAGEQVNDFLLATAFPGLALKLEPEALKFAGGNVIIK